jgi:glycosyltransferase involved in cell wall biosynthesis
LRHFDHVIAVSGATRDRLIASGLDPARLSILYNGIDIEVWRPGPLEPAAAALRLELGLPDRSRLVGFIGRLSPEKDAPAAMEVARRVLEGAPDTHVMVVGDGAARADLPAMIDQRSLAGRVHVLGHRPVSSALYQALDVYYMTSRTEGLPNTLLEAMACGRPSVVTAVGGIPELVGDSSGAILCAPGDVEGLAGGILSLLRDPAKAEAMGRAARQRIEASFSFAERMRRIEAVYDTLAAEAGRSGLGRWIARASR